MKKLLCVILLVLLMSAIVSAHAEEIIAARFTAEYPDAMLLELHSTELDPDAYICLFRGMDSWGVVIYLLEADGTVHAVSRNDTLIPRCEDEAYEMGNTELWYDCIAHDVSYDFFFDLTDDGEWIVAQMLFRRDDRDILYTLIGDGEQLCVSALNDDQGIWWPLELDLRLSAFDLYAVCDECAQAFEYMLSGDNPMGYHIGSRLDWDWD